MLHYSGDQYLHLRIHCLRNANHDRDVFGVLGDDARLRFKVAVRVFLHDYLPGHAGKATVLPVDRLARFMPPGAVSPSGLSRIFRAALHSEASYEPRSFHCS
jgi:hypothetical protein